MRVRVRTRRTPRTLALERGGGGKGEAFNFSCCLHDQPEAEILAEEYAAVHGA